MKQYKLINKTTREETICTKVVIDGFYYYCSDDKILNDEPYISLETNYATDPKERYVLYYLGVGLNGKNPKKVIATNNPSIDIGQVIDEIEINAMDILKNKWWHLYTFGYPKKPFPTTYEYDLNNVKGGLYKSLETHTLSDDEVVEFLNFESQWLADNKYRNGLFEYKPYGIGKDVSRKELLQLFKEQQIKTIYYE